MRHNIIVDGVAFRLRPISDADADFVLGLRNDARLNMYIHSTSVKLSDQLNWLSDYYERTGDYYFVVERKQNESPEGVVAIYNINQDNNDGEWGRWILKSGSVAAIESAWLAYQAAFTHIKLKSVCCRTLASNLKVVSFHDSCGINKKRTISNYFNIDGVKLDAVEHCIDYASWGEISQKLYMLAKYTARKLNA